MSKFIVSKGSGLRIRDLGNLSQLLGKLSILGLQNMVNMKEVMDANLKNRHKIEDLTVELGYVDAQNETLTEMLEPHQNLKKLTVQWYWGFKFPSWIGDPSFSSMVQLSLSDC